MHSWKLDLSWEVSGNQPNFGVFTLAMVKHLMVINLHVSGHETTMNKFEARKKHIRASYVNIYYRGFLNLPTKEGSIRYWVMVIRIQDLMDHWSDLVQEFPCSWAPGSKCGYFQLLKDLLMAVWSNNWEVDRPGPWVGVSRGWIWEESSLWVWKHQMALKNFSRRKEEVLSRWAKLKCSPGRLPPPPIFLNIQGTTNRA